MAQPPPIDPRDRVALIAQTTELARRFSGWTPPADGSPDLGTALIGVFGRFAEQVVERINRAPQRGYLAFLDLIGIQPLPPQPARVPITFALAEGSPADALVPAGTQVAAPATDTEPDETVYETQSALVVSRAHLTCVRTADPRHDTYSDHSATAGQVAEPFPVFGGDQDVPHELYLGLDPGQVSLATGQDLTLGGLVLRLATAPDAISYPLAWSGWDGTGWAPVDVQPVSSPAGLPAAAPGTAWTTLLLPPLPALAPREINGVSARWLRATVPFGTPALLARPPKACVVGRRAPLESVSGVAPFGDSADAKMFYLDLDLPVQGTGTLDVRLSTRGVAAPGGVQITWSVWTGDPVSGGWAALTPTASGTSALTMRDVTQNLTRNGAITFTPGAEWRTAFNGRDGRWLRAAVTSGSWATAPVIDSITVTHDWNPPQVSAAEIAASAAAPAGAPPAGISPPVALLNSATLDTTKDFWPFGQQPAFGDTLYLACPDAVIDSTGPITLWVRLTNAAGKPSPLPAVALTPGLTWETYDGVAWRAATASRADVFTRDGDVVLTPGAAPVATPIGGVTRIWVRARLTGGDYGQPAGYQLNAAGVQEFRKPTLAPPVVTMLRWRPGTPVNRAVPAAVVTRNDWTWTTRWPAGTGPAFPLYATAPDRDPALYLGFEQPFAPSLVSLYLPVDPPAPEEVAADRFAELDPDLAATVVWEYWGAQSWQPLAAIDGTTNLAAPGVVEFVGPGDQEARSCFGETRFWLRVRWGAGDFAVPPRLRGVLPNTVWASSVITVRNEILGSSSGDPEQAFSTSQSPVLPGQHVQVRETLVLSAAEADQVRALGGDDAIAITLDDAGEPDETWIRWRQVPDLNRSGPQDRHYTLDPLTGQVRFGGGRRGLAPPPGASNLRITYRTGGGASGNREADAVTELKTSLASIDAVTNHQPAQGGAARESIARVSERGPRVLRHRDRCVTAADLEDLAGDASPDVARAKAVPPGNFDPLDLWLDPAAPVPAPGHAAAAAGRAGVIIVPDSQQTRPTPTLGLIRLVREHLLERSPATSTLWVAGPEWIEVTAAATIVPVAGEPPDSVRAAVLTALTAYLHPLTGGPSGRGWDFGRTPRRSDLFALLEAVDGVDHISALATTYRPESQDLAVRLTQALDTSLSVDGRGEAAPDLRRWLDRALVCSGPHSISMTLRG